MDVRDAVVGRRSTRAFLDKHVPRDAILRVLEDALWAPSGGNLQPWHVHVVAGAPLARFKAEMQVKVNNDAWQETPAYQIYPEDLKSPYRERRYAVGEAMYGVLDIPRHDRAARRKWFARNFDFFGARLALFISVDRAMGPPQWADLGIMMQTLMLLLRKEGLESCPQECWALYPDSVADLLKLPSERMIFAGLAIGFGDPNAAVNTFVRERAPLEEMVSLVGF